ncbi:MAG: hypothetical protein AB7K08_00970 [Microbacteriaceae bacterium]
MTMDITLRGRIIDGPHEADVEGDANPRPYSYFRYGDRGVLLYHRQAVEVPVLDCLDVVLYGDEAKGQLEGLKPGDRVRVWGDLEVKRFSEDEALPPLVAVIARKVERDLGAE